MARLRFTAAYVADLASATAWYDKSSVKLGNRFRAAVRAGLRHIAKFPKLGAFVWSAKSLFYRLRRFPYLLLYQEKGDTVVVVGLRHSSRELGVG